MNNSKSFIIWNETNKQVILTCTDKLWEYLQNIRHKKMDNLDLIQLAKLYKELKTLDIDLEKENK